MLPDNFRIVYTNIDSCYYASNQSFLSISLCSGVDAMVHAIEAYTSKHKKNLVSDVLAREALALLSSNIRFVNNIVC